MIDDKVAISWAVWTITAINGSDELIHGKIMNPWIWIEGKAWTHEYEYDQNYEPVNLKSDKSMNSWISFVKNPWTREYEY